MAPSTTRTSAASSSRKTTRQYQAQRHECYYYENVDPRYHQNQKNKQQQEQSRQRGGTNPSSSSSQPQPPHAKQISKKQQQRGGKKANNTSTGIERSYETVTKAILTAASSFGASTSSTTTTTSNIHKNNSGTNTDAVFSSNHHPVKTATTTTTTIPHSNTNLSSNATANTTDGRESMTAAPSIGASLLYATNSMSTDEFEKLRNESRMLREEHDRRISNAGYNNQHHHTTTNLHSKNEVAVAVDKGYEGRNNGVNNMVPSSSFENRDEVSKATTQRKSSIDTSSSSEMYSSKLGNHHHPFGGGNNHYNGGMVKLTSDGLTKIRDILHNIGTTSSKDNDDVMSFYCSDDKTGKIMRQRISLAEKDDSHPRGGRKGGTGGEDEGGMNVCEEEAVTGGRSRAMPQSPTMRHSHQNQYHRSSDHHHLNPDAHDNNRNNEKQNPLRQLPFVTPMLEAATKTADHALPKLEAATKTAVRATMDGVDVAARTVAKVAVQSVEGVGMLAKDLANAKTPARSNVTTAHRHHDSIVVENETGRYADYVHDPNYKFVRTPTNNNDAARDDNAHVANAKAHAVLAGAIAAAKCDLSPSNPNSLEFHEGGIPRVLVVHDDWEERAGFVRSTEEAMLLTGGEGMSRKGEVQHYAIEADANVPRTNRRISNPVDVDEETATINGEEVDAEVLSKLWMGTVGAAEALVQGRDSTHNTDGHQTHEAATNANIRDVEEEDSGDYDDPRNASMWVAVPDNYMEEDAPDDYLDTTIVRARDILRMGGRVHSSNQDDIADQECDDSEEEEEDDEYERTLNAEDVNMGDLLLENENDEEGVFSPLSAGSHTFFVGDVKIGFESNALAAALPKNNKRSEYEKSYTSPASFVGNIHVGIDCESNQLLVKDAKSWATDSNDGKGDNAAGKLATAAAVNRCTRLDDLELCQKVKSHSFAREEDSLACLANALAAAVIKDKQRKDEMKELESNYKDSNRQVMFDLRHERDPKATEFGDNYAGLYLNPSESTDLSHSPPVRIVEGCDTQELRINPSESTDLSLFSNWANEPAKKKVEVALAPIASDEGGRRQLKGRIILVRIKKKLSKVAKKMLFIKWNKKNLREIETTPESCTVNIPSPATNYPDPFSPSSESIGASVTSSIMTGAGGVKRIIGAVPPTVGSSTHAQNYLYGTIHYGHRSSEDSTVGGDSLPPPPECIPRANCRAAEKEDEFSYLAEAMRKGRCVEDEDGLLLYVTPKVDGTGEEVQFIQSMDGTPVPFREIIDDAVEEKENDGLATTSEVKPSNLSCLFTNEATMSTMEIMDAIEVDGQIVLSPHHVNNNVAHVFRQSYSDEPKANLLPGSIIDSECDESDTLCYHDGCTVIHQTSTFGDNTIATDPSTRPLKSKTPTPANNAMDIGTPILSPDGPPLTLQAKKNGSFLFSPNNMGRADPSIRAVERAAMKNVKPSITMLPPAKEVKTIIPAGENKLLAIKQRYSKSSIESKNAHNHLPVNKLISPLDACAFDSFAIRQKVSSENTATTAHSNHQAEFQVKMNEFQDILNTFSSDGSQNEEDSLTAVPASTATSKEDEMKTPLVENASKTKYKYKNTPYPVADATSDDDTRRLSSPLVVALNPSSSSPTSNSIASIPRSEEPESAGKKTFSAEKIIPKSALKTRKGLVKDRVHDIQHRLITTTTSISPTNGAVTDVNGRLKRNHSYRSKKCRRMTNGDGVLAPRKAILQTTYIRSVPIGIAKSYSRDSREEKECQKEYYGTSYAAKYSMEMPKPNSSSPDSIKLGGGSSVSDASSYVSETTECDPFNTLLGKMNNSSEDDDDDEQTTICDDDKENNADSSSSNNSIPSPAARLLPFKSSTLVRPTEINQREQEFTRAPLSPVLMPMKARSWRELAVKAATAAEKTKGNNSSNSSRFRSEESWRKVSRM